MPKSKPQSFRSHASVDPFYMSSGLIIALNLVLAIILLIMSLHTQLLLGIWIVALSAVVLMLFLKLRAYPLRLQDRIIRLEERIRLDALLSEPLRKRIPELSEDQLIGLRFAPDEEIPSLVELTLDKGLNRRQIKERIQNWRPDHWRI
jgi:hypothetical protein